MPSLLCACGPKTGLCHMTLRLSILRDSAKPIECMELDSISKVLNQIYIKTIEYKTGKE